MEPQHYPSMTPYQRRRVREAYVKAQNNLCWYCHTPLTGPPHHEALSRPLNMALFPPGFLDYPIHLHHDHDTGFTVGATHSYCNGVLFQYHNQ